jgi:hypothetical protein
MKLRGATNLEITLWKMRMVIPCLFPNKFFIKELLLSVIDMHSVSDVTQIEICTAEWLVLGQSSSEFEIAIANLKKYKSPASDQIPAELTQARGETLIHKLLTCIWNKGKFPDWWKEFIIVPTKPAQKTEINGCWDLLHWPRNTLYQKKLALNFSAMVATLSV